MKTTKVGVFNNTTPIPGLALVAEGGGQRGAFTAGVLDYWQVAKFNPFEILVGTSAGAQNVASYISNQTGYAYSLINDLTRNIQFFNPWRVFSNNNVMDLDWYFEQTQKSRYLFDYVQADRNAVNRKVRFAAANLTKLTTELIDPVEDGWQNALKHSSAIPYLYKSKDLVDGGVTAPIPVHEAYQLGAQNILVIRTSDETKEVIPKPVKQLKPLLCRENHCPQFIKLLDKHETTYRQAEQFIQTPPIGVKVMAIRPTKPLKTKVLGSSQQEIIHDYKHGLELGKAFIEQHSTNLVTH
ncbi:patatin family protein [Psychrosphaera sp. F3M07]|uniref:patatin-like phospholipase family protein n=1 Tax=Psychrosphaera sp. F3M07 TaxID=2841560 RepID=UPI001C09CCF7|nr:patatin family protein [Psychrosphaera sp. F3M07]MBU2917922.1 patatin family protein [Psychrosphaera sp. F3M07]